MTAVEQRMGRVLVAGVGNIFLGDDGFGCEVARRLLTDPPGGQVRVVDYGVGGIHLAYDLLDDYELLILIDTMQRGAQPGTLAVLEVGPDDVPDAPPDAHAMDPVAVLANVGALGGELPRTLVVACEPNGVDEGMGLSETVAAAVGPAAELVHEVIAEQGPASPDEEG